MAKEKYKKKSPDAEQQTTSGTLANPADWRSAYAPGDWIVYETDGTQYVLSNAEFQAQYE